jgi:hypothetical protein
MAASVGRTSRRSSAVGFEGGVAVLEREILGWLGADRRLYCSEICAARAGQRDAEPVDQDEFDALMEEEGLVIGASCPACGTRYPVAWAEPDEE